MPFCGVSVMDRKREFVMLASVDSGVSIRELCRRFGISPTTAYKWLGRYEQEGLPGLLERSRRPKASPARTTKAIEDKVLEVRDNSNDAWGGRKIKKNLEDRGEANIPAASTITEILRRHNRLSSKCRQASGAMAALRAREPERALANGL